jgi:tetratricopeptide (TPR) repeat protein
MRLTQFLASVLLATVAQISVPAQAQAKVDRLAIGGSTFATLSGSYLAGRMAMSLRDMDAASTFLQTALNFDPTNQVIIDRTFLLMVASGRIPEGMSLADRVLAKDKGNAFVRMTLAADAMKKGKLDRARQQLTAITPRPVTDLTAIILQAWAIQGQGDTDLALKTVEKATGQTWYASFKTFHAGLIADLAGRKSEALKRLQTAYETDPNVLRVADAYARALARAGNKEEALKVLTNYEKVIPEHPMIMQLRADIEADKPIAPLVATVQQGAAELLYGLGTVLGRDGGEEMAALYLQLALMLEPKGDLSVVALATQRAKLRDYEEAINVLERIEPTSPMFRIVQLQIGRYYNALQKPEDARRHIQLVLDKTPNDVDAATALADVLRVEKRYADAANAYSKAIALIGKPTKNDWSLYYYRGTAYERSKQWDKAEPDFLKALELNPTEADILNYLGYSWVDMGRNLDKGLELIRQAVELQPDNGYIVDSLGWAYYRLGNYEEATKHLEKAVLLRPEDPTLNDHLGDAYWHVDRKLEARFQWNHARDLKPDPADLPRILKKIETGSIEEAAPAPAAAQAEVPKPPQQP